MTPTLQTFKRLFNYWPLFITFTGFIGVLANLFFLPLFIVGAYFTFKGTKDLIQGVGPFYWITRNDPRYVGLGIGTMHELNAPWRKGQGVYIVLCKRSFQIGICHKQVLNEVDGTLSAIQGRYMDTPPSEIGNW